MCVRTTVAVNKDDLEAYYRASFEFDFKPTYNAAPSQLLPVLREPHKIELAKWGFLPKWMKDKQPQGLFNARSETVLEKPSFKSAIVSHRCLVPVTGFYEWQGLPGNRQPYYITLKNQKIFTLAGLWQEWLDENKHPNFTYAILTTTPNNVMKPIHDRMPVILKREDENKWLDYNLAPSDLKNFFVPYPDQTMQAIAISKLVNATKNNSSDLIKPLKVL